MRTLLLLSLSFCLCMSETYAGVNGSLSGTVTNAQNKAITGVSVRVVKTTRGAYTKGDGSYKVVNIPAGTYEVKYTAVGYQEHVQRVQIKADGEMEVGVVMKDAPPVVRETVQDTIKIDGYPYKRTYTPCYGCCCLGCIYELELIENPKIKPFDISYLSAAPNPSTGNDGWKLTLQSPSEQSAIIQIADYSGRIVWQQEHLLTAGDQSVFIPSQGLDGGWYIMRVQGHSLPGSSPLVLQR